MRIFFNGTLAVLLLLPGLCLSQVAGEPRANSSDIVAGLQLNAEQLNTDLGVGNATPPGARRYAAWQGWRGPGTYTFVAADFTTPYLTGVQQLNNWNYVLFRTSRTAVESGGAAQDVSAEIRAAADNGSKAASIAGPINCTGSNNSGIQNNTHGTIRILSGTGAFETVSAANKVLTVAPGSRLEGTLSLRVLNGGPSFAVAPLIGTASWGDPSTAFWPISSWVKPGEQTLTAPLNLVAPSQIGTHHILFAMQLELSAANVASGTNWDLHHDIWGDGNDISQFDQSQIAQAQEYGCAVDRWRVANGYQQLLVPSDAITLRVAVAPSQQKPRATVSLGQSPEEVTAILGSPKNIVDLGVKKVYVYEDRKITFTGGKVSDVQ